MSAGKVLAIGAVGIAAALLVAAVASASSSKAAPPNSTIPPNFQPPANATRIQIPPGHAGIPFALNQSSWTVAGDASGAQPGTYTLVQNASNPNVDWIVTFTGVGGGSAGIVGVSPTPNGGLMAQAAAAGL